ncbi:cytochrome c biogenesis protein [Anaeromyxobacter oryzisoli]|uniref:cytochrome c biogenesis protein n=1 Tax=Anaeromyxobacter oryzisoli TaxID=2925408 RepID=UPI001F57E94D|nr:cytochrome c biogenesis protein CcsA [Anaeromyxobacter sp. SG63]
MNKTRLAFWGAALCALAGAAVMLVPQGKVRGFDVDAFGHLPVLEGGRVKPVDTVARNALLMIRSQQSFRHEGRTIGADEWLLDVLFRPEVADEQKAFVINDPQVLGLMHLQQTGDRYYAFKTLRPFVEEIQRQGEQAQQVDPKQRTPFQNAVANLYDRVFLYLRLENTVQLAQTPGLAWELASLGTPEAATRRAALSEAAYFRPFVSSAASTNDAWQSAGEALDAAARGRSSPQLVAWARMSLAYRAGDPASFDRAAAEALAAAGAAQPGLVAQSGHELVFNRAQPFYVGMVVYVLALLAVFVSWLWRPEWLRPAAYGLLVAGAVIHTAGLASRVVLQGRPPVTNLYSSAVFVGWGAVLLGAVLERIYRKGFGTAVAAAAGFASLIVAHHLTGDGDTMEMMRAVLDSNFWLGTHVVTITIGYSGTFLAGALAIAWTVRRHLLRGGGDPATSKAIMGMTYGVVCFALFFSFLGTVLGGIWADQSWGRFWGWDPKENGALLIVLWNAIILHARWGGYVRERGIMAMAILGNVITSLSWFGVNMLGVGLHSYGFMDKAFWALSAFIASQLAIMVFTVLPPRFWEAGAFSRAAKPSSAPAAGK